MTKKFIQTSEPIQCVHKNPLVSSTESSDTTFKNSSSSTQPSIIIRIVKICRLIIAKLFLSFVSREIKKLQQFLRRGDFLDRCLKRDAERHRSSSYSGPFQPLLERPPYDTPHETRTQLHSLLNRCSKLSSKNKSRLHKAIMSDYDVRN